MKFKINNTEWEIKEVEKDKMTCESSEWTQGLTVYLEQKILLLKGQPNIERTLKHELTHVWLYEYGHNQHDENKKYSYEDVCEIVASSNDFINEVVKQYKNQGRNDDKIDALRYAMQMKEDNNEHQSKHK